MKNSIRNFSEKIIYSLSALIFTILFFTSIVITAQIQLREIIHFVFNYYWLLSLPIYIYLIFLLLKNSKKIKEKTLLLCFSIFYIIFGVLIIMSISGRMRADTAIVHEVAEYFSNNNFEYFEHGKYMSYYPHQIGLMYYYKLLNLISTSGKFVFLINIFEIITINYSMYRIVKILGKDNHDKNILSIFLSFTFLPQFFFLTFGYNLIPGFCFCILSIWMYLEYLNKRNLSNLIISIVFIVISTIIRNNFVIAFIAIVMYHLFFESNKKIGLVILLSFLIINICFNLGIKLYTENKTGLTLENGTPKTMWVAMGTKPDNVNMAPGWYTSWMTDTLKQYNYDYNKIDEVAKNQIASNFSYFASNPFEGLKYFTGKFLSTWIEPSFQSFWSGPREIYDQPSYNSFVRSIYNNGNIYSVIFTFMKASLLIIYGSILYYIFKIKKDNRNLLFIIYFLGGVAFHLIWETKAQYVYPYIFMTLPIVVEVLFSIYNKLFKR